MTVRDSIELSQDGSTFDGETELVHNAYALQSPCFEFWVSFNYHLAPAMGSFSVAGDSRLG